MTSTAERVTYVSTDAPVDMRLVGALSSIGSVLKIRACTVGRRVYVWVLMETSNRADAERVYAVEQDCMMQPGAAPIDVRVIPLDRVGEAQLPTAQVIFDRANPEAILPS